MAKHILAPKAVVDVVDVLKSDKPLPFTIALDQFTVDVENVVLKVYGYFPISAKRRESLKDYCQFCDVEFHEILRHVSKGGCLSIQPSPVFCKPGLLSGLISSAKEKSVPDRSDLC